MKRTQVTGYLILAAVLLATPAIFGQSGHSAEPTVLPASLDELYPPKAPAPVYLIRMIELSTPLSGMVSDLMQGDQENVGKTFEKFRAQYMAVAKMVPEWESSFPVAPVEELGAALQTKDPGKVMAAVDKIGKTCHSCHTATMVATHQRFHWGSFSDIAATDPLSKQTVPYTGLMQMLDGNLSGVATDLEQGQFANARANADGLKARLGELKQLCEACHDSERKYFVDDNVFAKVDELRTALSAATVDPQVVGGLIQTIGTESCHKCHLVHAPAALSPYKRTSAKSSH